MSASSETQGLIDRLDQSRSLLADAIKGVSFGRVIHDSWRVHDLLGHIAVWELEAVHSLRAYADGSEYRIRSISSGDFASTNRYNQSAANERALWAEEQIRSDLEVSREAVKEMLRAIPEHKLGASMLFPWGTYGSVEQLVEELISHESEHAAAIRHAHGEAANSGA